MKTKIAGAGSALVRVHYDSQSGVDYVEIFTTPAEVRRLLGEQLSTNPDRPIKIESPQLDDPTYPEICLTFTNDGGPES